MDKSNPYDQRIQFLELWLRKKEDEYKARVNLPPAHLKKSDSELFEQYDKPMKKAREKIVSKLLMKDEYGNEIKKEYKDLTSKELHTIVENVAVRMYMFNYDYPKFFSHAVQAVIEHPNLQRADKDMLLTYCKMFELDWTREKEGNLNKEFMCTHPIHLEGANLNSYGEIDNERVKNKLKRACI